MQRRPIKKMSFGFIAEDLEHARSNLSGVVRPALWGEEGATEWLVLEVPNNNLMGDDFKLWNDKLRSI